MNTHTVVQRNAHHDPNGFATIILVIYSSHHALSLINATANIKNPPTKSAENPAIHVFRIAFFSFDFRSETCNRFIAIHSTNRSMMKLTGSVMIQVCGNHSSIQIGNITLYSLFSCFIHSPLFMQKIPCLLIRNTALCIFSIILYVITYVLFLLRNHYTSFVRLGFHLKV